MQAMQVEELAGVDSNVDLTQILPIQQKRTIAFINHFIMQTVSYLNTFAQSCESRFMEFEYKMQKIEASLLILESQLSSISGLDNIEPSDSQPKVSPENNADPSKLDLPDINLPSNNPPEKTAEVTPATGSVDGVKASEDPRYKKFFKMLQFGVPEPAVKLKMKNEGVDPSILNNPNDIIPGSALEVSQHSVEQTTSD